MTAGAEWLHAQFKVPHQGRRQAGLDLLDKLRAAVEPGVYEVSNDSGGAPRLYLRVEKFTRPHPSGDRDVELTYLWILAGSEEIPVKGNNDLQAHILQAITQNGKKISV